MATWYHWQGEDLLLTLRIQPRASRDEVAGPYGEALKVRITAPPVDGKANAHLLRFLAGLFDVPLAGVELISGEAGRDKRVKIIQPKRLPTDAGITPR